MSCWIISMTYTILMHQSRINDKMPEEKLHWFPLRYGIIIPMWLQWSQLTQLLKWHTQRKHLQVLNMPIFLTENIMNTWINYHEESLVFYLKIMANLSDYHFLKLTSKAYTKPLQKAAGASQCSCGLIAEILPLRLTSRVSSVSSTTYSSSHPSAGFIYMRVQWECAYGSSKL